ncbi:hypothetical protein [Aquella oligotrophica]|nr:hypothetical protein [Aquella oligotrophica]
MRKQTINIILLSIMAGLGIVACNNGSSSSPTPSPAPTPTPSPSPAPTPTPTPYPNYCMNNVANFDSLTGVSLASLPYDFIWGPSLANLPFPSSLESCNNYINWQQDRVLAAANYWVSQKVNYCHHHIPTWYPEYNMDGVTPNPDAKISFESCSNVPKEPVTNPAQIIRWNYSGTGIESQKAWYNVDSGKLYPTGNYGYGLDCSDYTKLNYAYAESIYFTSDVSMQAGQAANQQNLAPNMSGFHDSGAADTLGLYSAGNLVCNDGTAVNLPKGMADSTSCNGHGGYISVFTSSGGYNANALTESVMNNLQPGDLLYIAGLAYDYNNQTINPTVTHVVMWTGQKIGQSSWITDSMIAPETDIDSWSFHNGECGSQWWSAANNQGNWIITDSHYQGPDYRAFTECFYKAQVWGVRRVLGVNNN